MGLVKFLQGNEIATAKFTPGAILFDQSTGDLYIDVENGNELPTIGNYVGEGMGENQTPANRICLTRQITNIHHNYSIIDGGSASSVISPEEKYIIFDGGSAD